MTDIIIEERDTLFRKLVARGISSENCGESPPGLSTLDLALLLSRKRLIIPDQQSFEGKLVEDAVILAPAAVVSMSLLNVTLSPHVLPCIHDISVIYDDSCYQELTMVLDGIGGAAASVRLVRRCEPDHIVYFYPEPAHFLRHHCGDWLIRPLSPNATHLTNVQRWTRCTKAETRFSPRCERFPCEQVSAVLREQARLELTAWKHYLERRAEAAE